MSPAQRAPVWPSRPRSERWSRSMPRPSAAARPEHQRRARGRVDLLVVVHFEDLDVEVLIERLGHALDQRRQQVDPETHVAGLDDHRALAGLRDQLVVLAAQPGGADDVHQPPARRELGEGDGRRRHGEVEEPVGLREQRLDLGGHAHAVLAQPRKLTGITADHGRSRRLDRAREGRAVHRRNGMDERAPHAPAGAGYDQPHIGHRFSPRQRGAGITGWRRERKQRQTGAGRQRPTDADRFPTERPLLRFCNVGSFPQNGPPAPPLPRQRRGPDLAAVTLFQCHVRAKSGKRACTRDVTHCSRAEKARSDDASRA